MRRIQRYITTYDLFCVLYTKWKFGRSIVIPHRNTHVRISENCRASGAGQLLLGIQWELGRYMPSQMIMRSGSSLTVNDHFSIYSGCSIWINSNARLTLGSGYINNNLNLSCFESISIGNDVAISENVTIRDSDNYSLGASTRTRPIKIEDHVWIGTNATILKGVTIGSGSVVAAGALVNRDVPPNTLVAGVPATIKKKNVDWH